MNFVSKKRAIEDVLKPRFASAEVESNDEPAVGKLTIEGPYNTTGPGNTPSRQKVFICRPSSRNDEEACAGKILGAIARHAYRRPITQVDIARLLEPYKIGRNEGGFEAGIEMGLQRILV